MFRTRLFAIPIALFIFSFGYPILPISEAFCQDRPANKKTVTFENLQAKNQAVDSEAGAPAKKTRTSPAAKVKEGGPLQQTDLGATSVEGGLTESDDDAERDIMEEALALLDESHTYWVNGDLEDALEMLDQAYALLLDANGSPDTARQKDDLRLMISKRILAIYNSIQTVSKGSRSEVPILINADVEKEIRQFQTVERDFFISSYQRSTIYRPTILRELKKAGLPEELSWLPLVESGFKISALSSARALGLWQFIPSTGYKYGLNRDDWVDERMDVEKSTRAAIDYLKELHRMFGDWLTVLAGYNCGEGRVIRTIAAQHINYLDRFWDLYRQLPYETARYVPRFLATLLIIKDPQKYGMDLGATTDKGSMLSYEVVEINKSMQLRDIAQKLETPEETLNILNAELRHKLTPDKPYKLKVPIETAEQLLKVVDDIPEADRPRSFSSAGRTIRHKVKQGETIASIAKRYKTSVSAIRASNNLSGKQQASAGQRLNIPMQAGKRGEASKSPKAEKPIQHTVQKGDTLLSLSRKYDTTAAELKKTNQLSGDRLKVGQIIRIHKGKEETEQPGKKEKESGKKSKKTTKAIAKPSEGKDSAGSHVKKYTVKKGDNLAKIARENNVPVEKLLQWNKLALKENIRPGQVIMIK